jgi:hypothetical protein
LPVTSWPIESVTALNAFYGDPRGKNGEASVGWESANLVDWVPPYPMFYSDGKMTLLKNLRIHQKCLSAFDEAFKAVLDHFGEGAIKTKRLNISGGTYCYRLQRGGSRLSVHSWGCAIDIDPAHNPFPSPWKPYRGMIDPDFAEILQAHGFTWRGSQNDIDPMHFQLAQR